MLATRHQEEGKLGTRLAARLTRPAGHLEAECRRSFNAVQLGLVWREIEPAESRYDWAAADAVVAAARGAGMPVTAGPVIDISPGMLPDWAAGWNGDLPTLAAFMCDFLETAIARYKGDVRRWVVCGGFNHADGLGLGDDDRLRLAARLFESASHIDPELDLVLSIAQPWGDYLVNDDQTISPLAFADDLIRTGLRVSAVELELRTGCVPRGSLPRDPLRPGPTASRSPTWPPPRRRGRRTGASRSPPWRYAGRTSGRSPGTTGATPTRTWPRRPGWWRPTGGPSRCSGGSGPCGRRT